MADMVKVDPPENLTENEKDVWEAATFVLATVHDPETKDVDMLDALEDFIRAIVVDEVDKVLGQDFWDNKTPDDEVYAV